MSASFRRIAVLLAAALLVAAFAACGQRNPPARGESSSSSSPSSSQEESSSSQEEEPPQEEEEPSSSEASSDDAAQVFTSDYAQLAGLDTTRYDWGPGGPVDEKNRSQGALAYNEQFGKYNAVFVDEESEDIYLTFDMGYENGYTPAILDTLKKKEVKGVFFLTGHYVESQPELVQRMIDEGHVLGNHSWDHPENINELPLEEVESSIMTLHEYVKENFDYTMRLWRCPAGVFTEQQLALAQQLGYRSVFWSFAYRDWLVDDQPDPAEALDTMLTKAHPGAIYLIHAVSQTNSQILGQVIDGLEEQGFAIADPNDLIQ